MPGRWHGPFIAGSEVSCLSSSVGERFVGCGMYVHGSCFIPYLKAAVGVICLEEFTKGRSGYSFTRYSMTYRHSAGSTVARLSCFCSFHNGLTSSSPPSSLPNVRNSMPLVMASTWQKLSGSCSLIYRYLLSRSVHLVAFMIKPYNIHCYLEGYL